MAKPTPTIGVKMSDYGCVALDVWRRSRNVSRSGAVAALLGEVRTGRLGEMTPLRACKPAVWEPSLVRRWPSSLPQRRMRPRHGRPPVTAAGYGIRIGIHPSTCSALDTWRSPLHLSRPQAVLALVRAAIDRDGLGAEVLGRVEARTAL